MPSPQPQELELLQYEVLDTLMRFIYQRDSRSDEDGLFQKLEYLWTQNAPKYRQQMGRLYDSQGATLHAWIEERRKISQLQRALDGQPGVPPMEMIERLLAMNDLRVMRLKWKSMKIHDGERGISPEELLCRTFAMITKTEGTESIFMKGLEKLNETNLEFLRTEDMKISVSNR